MGKHGVVCHVIGREIGLKRERAGKRILGFVDPAEQPQRDGHQSPCAGMVGMPRRHRSAHRNRLVVSFEREERHVPRDRRIYRKKRIKRSDLPRPRQRIQTALRLTAACEGVTKPCVPKRKIRIDLYGLRELPHRVVGAALARMTEPKHEVPTLVVLIERQRHCASFKRFLG